MKKYLFFIFCLISTSAFSQTQVITPKTYKYHSFVGDDFNMLLYEGKSSNSQKYSAYKNFKVTDLHRLLNEDFSKAIEQIRNKIIENKYLFIK